MCNNQFEIKFFDRDSEDLFKKREHAFIGISPFSSYFNEINLVKLLRWSGENFQEVTAFIPDTLSVFTLEGLGYSEKNARYKTKRQDAYLFNKIMRARDQLDLLIQERINIVKYSELVGNEIYQKIYNECVKKFQEDEAFRADCLNATTLAIISHAGKVQNSLKAVEYFLREFPIFIDVPSMLGKKSSMFVYHAIPTLIRRIYENRHWVSSSQGCLQLALSTDLKTVVYEETSPKNEEQMLAE